MGGLGDILGQLQKQLGQQGSAPGMSQGGSQGGGQQAPGGLGGLGDILGQLQKQLGGAGQQGSAGQGGGYQQQGQPGAAPGGNIMDILGQILGQATSGVKEGAGKLDQMTGASKGARDLTQQTTGQSPEELMRQLQEWARNNPGTAAAGAGGLGAVVLGTRTGRSLATSAAKLGALALIGGLAYKAYQNYAQGRPPFSTAQGQQLLEGPAPTGSGFEPDAISNDSAILYIRAMIAAAAADGRIDQGEQQKIMGGLQQAGLAQEARDFVQQEIQNPASPADLAGLVGSPAEAVQVFTAARFAVDLDTQEENDFLVSLAQQLRLDGKLVAHIDSAANAATAG